MKCVKCGSEHNGYRFPVLQVQTLHVRDVNREKRVQALGDFEEYTVCPGCAEDKYRRILDTGSIVRKNCLLYGGLMVLGILLCLLFWQGEGVFRLLGLGLIAGGGLCLGGNIRNAAARKRELLSLGAEEALRRCAWECMLEGAPKKNDINDITYIPIDETTLSRKNGDLMILYDLLPEIAVEAHKRIHEQAEN